MPAAEQEAACEHTVRPPNNRTANGVSSDRPPACAGTVRIWNCVSSKRSWQYPPNCTSGGPAERPRIAAPALSELIRRLERELSTPLLTRTTRQVVLTSAGAELLSRSKVTLDEAAAAKAAVRRVAEPITAG